MAEVWVARTLVDTRSSINIMYYNCRTKLGIEADLQPPMGLLIGFSREMVVLVGTVHLPITLGSPMARVRKMVEFVMLDLLSTAFNIFLGRPALNAFQTAVSSYYLKMKFLVGDQVGEIYESQRS